MELKINLLSLKESDPAAYGLTRASLIQKLIRRGLTSQALWVSQLFINDGHHKGLKRKLYQIAAEDIGLGNPEIILKLKQEDDLLKNTALLCQSPKNREVNRFISFLELCPQELLNDSQVNLEVQTLKSLLEANEIWFNNKRKKENLINFKNLISSLNQEKSLEISTMFEVYLELAKANTFGAKDLLAFITLISTRNNLTIPEISLEIPQLESIEFVPDFALDRHTPFGKILNRGFNHWIKEGMPVFPEIFYPSLYTPTGQEKYPMNTLIKYLK